MFSNLEERFKQKVEELYAPHSTRDKANGVKGIEPFLEFKPDDPRRNETANDTRIFPPGAIRRDFERLGRFLGSPRGLLFLAQQQVLQTGQPIAESRILNPLFVIGNVQPYKRLSRILASPKNFTPSGDVGQMSPASLDSNVGSAGRLQKGTAKVALLNVTGKNGRKGILDLLPANQLFSTIGAVFSLKDEGSTGVNERPEFNVSNKLYAVQLRNNFTKINDPRTSLNNAKAALRTGDIAGALSGLKKAVNDTVNGTSTSLRNTRGLNFNDLNNPNNLQYNGKRWFITDETNADRYIGNTSASPEEIASRLTIFPSLVTQVGINSTVNKFFKDTKNVFSDISQIGRSFGIRQLSTLPPSIRTYTDDGLSKSIQSIQSSPNPVEDSMLYDKLSLRNQYLNDESRIKQQRDQLAEQKKRGADWFKTRSNARTSVGLEGGLTAGKDLNADQTSTSNKRFNVEKYLIDRLNSVAFIDEVPDATEPSSITYNQLKKDQLGQDFIDVVFFDFVNKRSIPFRAFISNLTGAVSPNVSETPYIGRIERNIVYSGVKRTINFSLRLQAFDAEEMRNIWRKLNILTGLCYPSGYGEGGTGFMSPPFIKLTIGDIFRNQPAMIQNISHNFDTKTSWETIRENQAPHGVDVTISLIVIEKGQMDYDGIFYPVTLPRTTKELKFGDINKPKAAIPPTPSRTITTPLRTGIIV